MRYLLLFLAVAQFAFGTVAEVKDFSLVGTDGKSSQLGKILQKNEGVVVAFIATKCPVSNKYNERYNELAQKLAERKVAFLAVNANDTEDMAAVKEHAADKKFSFPVYKDEKHKVADMFGAQKTPEVYLLNKERQVLYHGRIDSDTDGTDPQARKDLLLAVYEFSEKKPITNKETAALGCSIKRK